MIKLPFNYQGVQPGQVYSSEIPNINVSFNIADQGLI